MMPTLESLKSILHYDPATGVFTWLSPPRNQTKVGDVAGCLNLDGYILISIDNIRHRAHRLAWLYMTGSWPGKQVDHRNRNRSDNRWNNLREANNAINQQNKQITNSNKIGLSGVSKSGRGFRATIKVFGAQVYLGTHNTPEQAHAAYLTAKLRLHPSFTP